MIHNTNNCYAQCICVLGSLRAQQAYVAATTRHISQHSRTSRHITPYFDLHLRRQHSQRHQQHCLASFARPSRLSLSATTLACSGGTAIDQGVIPSEKVLPLGLIFNCWPYHTRDQTHAMPSHTHVKSYPHHYFKYKASYKKCDFVRRRRRHHRQRRTKNRAGPQSIYT